MKSSHHSTIEIDSQSSVSAAGSSEGRRGSPAHPLDAAEQAVLMGTLLVLKVCLILIHKSCGQRAS